MNDHGPCQATPAEELRRQIMSPCVPKSEREWWAKRRIDELEKKGQLDDGDRQMVVLALAKLTFARPGWNHALREIAVKLDGVKIFEAMIKLGPDKVRDGVFKRGPRKGEAYPPGHPKHKPVGCPSLE